MERCKLCEWIKKFDAGEFNAPDRKTQIIAGWYDWFCRDTSLANKIKKMGGIIRQIKGTGKVDLEKTYVFFKNNCPLNGPLYDDFRICSLESGDVLFTIQLDCCWNKSKYTVYGRTPDGEFHSLKPLFETNNRRRLINWLNSSWESDKEKYKIGDKVKIIKMDGEPQYADKEGVIEVIDDIGQIHGTWGGCALIPGLDDFKIIK